MVFRYFGTINLKDSKELTEEVKRRTFPIVGDTIAERITGIIEMTETSIKNISPDAEKVVVIDFGDFGKWTFPRKIVTVTIDTTTQKRSFEWPDLEHF